MNEAIGATLPFALAIAISPVPIIATILLLMSEKAKALSVVFGITWFVGVLAVAGVFALLGGLIADQEQSDSGKPILATIKILLGLGLAYLALKKWMSRPRDGEPGVLPKWMESLTTLSLGGAVGIALLLVAVNPKNLMMEIAAGLELGQLGLSNGELWAALAWFAFFSSVTVFGPIVYFLVAPRAAREALVSVKGWLVQNNATVMVVLFAVLAAKLVGDGITLF